MKTISFNFLKNNKIKKLTTMAEIIENGMMQEKIPHGKINGALTTGIIGTSLAGLLALGKGGLLGNIFNGDNNNNSSNGCGMTCSPQLIAISAEEQYLERKQCADNLNTTKQYYQGVIDFNKTLTDSFFAAYERDVKNSFDLYKLSRDNKDELSKRIDEVDKKVDVMAAIRPYQDALINAKIDNVALIADFNLAHRTCRMIQGELVLPSTPTVTGYASYSPCNPVATA